MALEEDFQFWGASWRGLPEAEAMAIALFGANWRRDCECVDEWPRSSSNYASNATKSGCISFGGRSLLHRRAKGKMILQSLNEHGQVHDLPNGDPAELIFNCYNGTMEESCHYRDGEKNDPVEGRPAELHYSSYEGRPRACVGTVHYRDGKQHDPPSGAPAAVHYYVDGKVDNIVHFKDGEGVDVDGLPCTIHYDKNGNISYGEWADGRGYVSKEKMAEILCERQAKVLREVLGNAVPSVEAVGMHVPEGVAVGGDREHGRTI